jgi:MoxR-like ATPase
MNMEIENLKKMLDEQKYIYDEALVITLFVALKLGRPLLIEGAAGVGKTEVAKAMANALDRKLVRLQCYEGLDETKALYEWNYQKQLLSIQVRMGSGQEDPNELTQSLFGEEYLMERPLLKSIRSAEPVVLLIDEIDKADEEFEAFLLELLSEFQVSIPEFGTVRAKSNPFVVLTSNNTRPLSDALKRRCAYLYIHYPSVEKEVRIIKARLPGIDTSLAVQTAEAVKYFRESEKVVKKPSVAETLDWISALNTLGITQLDKKAAESTIGFVLKNNEDIEGILDDEGFSRHFD